MENFSPAHLPGIRASTTVTVSALDPPVTSGLSPWVPLCPAKFVKPSSSVPAFTNVTVTPAHTPRTGASSTVTVSGLDLPVMSSLSPWALSYQAPTIKPSSSVPALTTVTVTPTHTTGTGATSSATASSLNPPVTSNHSLWTPPYTVPSARPNLSVPLVSSAHDKVLTMVATAMKDISMTLQKLVYNQSLPPIQFQKFSGTPAEFPLFK